MARTNSTKLILPPDKEEKFLKLFVKDKNFYKWFFSLFIVIALMRFAMLMVNTVDNIMLGSYTELALSGATIVNQIQFVLYQLIMGVGSGVAVLASQYWGQKKIDPIKKIISLGLKIGLAIGIIFFILASIIPTQILSLITNDPDVVAEGVRYLSIIKYTYLIFSFSNALVLSLQAIESAFIGTIMSVSTIIINIILNYIFIFGHFGAPEMGVQGAAIATLTSRCVELIIILVYVLRIDKKLKMKAAELFQWDFTYIKDFIKVGVPLILNGMVWGVAQGVQTAVLGHINATAIAANSIAVAIFQIIAVFGLSCANVSQVITGKTIGAGNLHLIRAYAKTIQGLLIVLGIISCAVLFALKGPILSLYSVSPEAQELAGHFLIILCITIIGTCYEYPMQGGIISGGGFTSYSVIIDNVAMWCLSIPLAVLSAFVFNFPPEVTFCCLKVDQILKCIPNGIVVNRFRWARKLTR